MRRELGVILAVLVSFGVGTAVAAEKAVFTNYSSSKGCTGKTSHKSLRKACKSGKYNGTQVYECKKKCTKRKGLKCVKREWKHTDGRLCNSDGDRKGIYLTSCAGKRLDAKSMKKACALSSAKGETVVKCKRGKETKRRACASAANNDSEDYETGVFIDKCGGKKAKKANGKAIKRNLRKACKIDAYQGKSLVKCKNKCTKRKGLKCVRRTWQELSRVVCNDDNKVVKLKTCNETQASEIAQARTLARKRLKKIIKSMNTYIKNPSKFYSTYGDPSSRSSSDKARDLVWVKKSLGIAKSVRKKIKSMKSKYVCEGNGGTCGEGGANAHTMSYKRHKVSFCNGYLAMSVERKAAVLAHEISHNFKTDDLEYERSKIKDVEWWNNAETYEMWVEEKRLCIPGYDCP